MSMLRPSSNGSGLLALFEESGRNVERTGSLLRDLLDDFPEHSSLARDILICEQEGDRITHDIIHEMTVNGSKLDQRDAYELARALDDVVDYAEETADSLELYGVEAPMEQAQELAAVLADASVSVAEALAHLRSGEDVSAQLIEIHRLENEGDRLVRDGGACGRGHEVEEPLARRVGRPSLTVGRVWYHDLRGVGWCDLRVESADRQYRGETAHELGDDERRH